MEKAQEDAISAVTDEPSTIQVATVIRPSEGACAMSPSRLISASTILLTPASVKIRTKGDY